MKKVVIIMLIALSAFCVYSIYNNSNNNPYIGKYKSENNTIIYLEKNNACTMIINDYKVAFHAEGKYTVNNNNINITFDKNKSDVYGNVNLKGKFEGSRMTIYKSEESKECVYLKN